MLNTLIVLSESEFRLHTLRNSEIPVGFTHSGNCHADDVLAAYLYSLYCLLALNQKITYIVRLAEAPSMEELGINDIVFDLGGKFDNRKYFDHHQTGGPGISRKNNIPYSSVGLIWRKFGHEIVQKLLKLYRFENLDENQIWCLIDGRLIQPIDAIDNGLSLKESGEQSVCNRLSLSKVIGMCNNTYPGEIAQENENFESALFIFDIVFNNFFKAAISSVNAFYTANENIDLKSSNGNVIVFKEHQSWKDWMFSSENYDKLKTVKFVAFPNPERNVFEWVAVYDRVTGENRAIAPAEWRGKTQEEDGELEKVSGVPDAVFCHKEGFIGGARTKEGCLRMIDIMLRTG